MEVTYKNETYTLGKKERKVETEAPAVRVKMVNGETKVIGMMAPKTQVLITFPCIKAYNNGLHNILQEYASKTITYIITKSSDENLSKVKEAYGIDDGFISNEFKNFSLKFGVNINDELLAKSIFIVDKEGEIKYIEIPSNIETSFDLEAFKTALDEVVNFKQKGHTHEKLDGCIMAISDELREWIKDNDYDINNLNLQGKYGNSAIMKAAREGNIKIVKELIGLGADLDLKNVDGNSALWNSCFANSYDCFHALVDAGIDINSENVNGVTSLMYCASAGKEDFVQLLIENQANTEVENLDGFKAIDLAVTPKIFKMLKNARVS